MAPRRRSLLAVALAGSALVAGVSFVSPPRAAARPEVGMAVAAGMMPADALAASQSGGNFQKGIGDILNDDSPGSYGALGVAGLTWNAAFILLTLVALGGIFLPVLLSPFLSSPQTMLDVRSKPGYKRREYRQPGLPNPDLDVAPAEALLGPGPAQNSKDSGAAGSIPKISAASAVTN